MNRIRFCSMQLLLIVTKIAKKGAHYEIIPMSETIIAHFVDFVKCF